MKKIVIGILAHVDAGKTTLSEAMLYASGALRTLGRVDHKTAFLDTHFLERARGITIFSKQAVFQLSDSLSVTLIDTPGHVDFSAECERTLQILDYAVLVISSADGVQGHTETLWRLLSDYRIPTILFINKMDQPGANRTGLLVELQKKLNPFCLDFSITTPKSKSSFFETIALIDESLLDSFLANGSISDFEISKLITARRIFPCFFGSALRMEGVDQLLQAFSRYCPPPAASDDFGARIFKISRDEQGNRLTHMKVTGGILCVKDMIQTQEKVNQIRIYSGTKYETADEVKAGTVCAVTGLSKTYCGQGLGTEYDQKGLLAQPILTYRLILPDGCDLRTAWRNLTELTEEDPMLTFVYIEQLGEIQAHLMGDVQVEILKSLIMKRFGINVSFGPGNIIYQETILAPVIGIGHYEPLRHYAEVHLLLSPGKRGSGLVFSTSCSEDELDRNWQRLILTHLNEKEHHGVLTGSAITDMEITLIAGRSHQKHTEGGDFRQATYRAVRQGLMQAQSILLEPFYAYSLEVPTETIGRAISDVEKRNGTFDSPHNEGDSSILTGLIPAESIDGYRTELLSYTGGRGRLSLQPAGYRPCHNEAEVIERYSYESVREQSEPTGSVFCAHGSGFLVPWDHVIEYCHLDTKHFLPNNDMNDPIEPNESIIKPPVMEQPPKKQASSGASLDRELEEIFTRTYGPRKPVSSPPTLEQSYLVTEKKPEPKENYLLVDGYNVVFAWPELNELAKISIDGARERLMDLLCNYQAFTACHLFLVFDAYQVAGQFEKVMDYHKIKVVYTKEGETADRYIERLAHELGRTHHVTVATSDALEQVISLGQGCHILSSRELKELVDQVNEQIRQKFASAQKSNRNYLFQYAEDDLADYLEKIRLGQITLDS